MTPRSLMFALSVGLCVAGAANAQGIGYSPRTGDAWVDEELGHYNDFGHDNRDGYVDEIVSAFGAPRYLVQELLTTRRWNPGDVYFACALAYEARRTCGDVVQIHDLDPGQGWGGVAQRLGIKPGSAQFHALKGQMRQSRARFTRYPAGQGRSGPTGTGDAGADTRGQGH